LDFCCFLWTANLANTTTSYFDDNTDRDVQTKSYQDYDFEGVILELQRYMPQAQWLECRYIAAEMMRSRPPNEIWNWLQSQRRVYMPHVVGYRPCTHTYTYYIADTMQLPQHGTVLKCDECAK
jgi:hypothetical protein